MSDLDAETYRLENAVTRMIQARGGDPRNALKALIVANEYLEAELMDIRSKVSTGYMRGPFRGHAAMGGRSDY